MTATATAKLLLSTPVDILGALPYLLGFHPTDSLVVAGLAGKTLRLTIRWDLPSEADGLDRLVTLLGREGVTAVVIVGYGSGSLVTPAIDDVIRRFEAADITVIETLRTENGRYWSYSCRDSTYCPAEGVPYDQMASPVAAQAVVLGMVALPDRHSLRRSVEPYGGPGPRQATRRVAAHLRAELARPSRRDGDRLAAKFVADGLARVRSAIECYQAGGRLDDDEAARIGFDLAIIRIRDEAWALIDDRHTHVTLWRDLTRRLETRYVAPAASLLAAAAWRAGDCALAGVAVERALAADPGYSMAILLRQALAHLLSPAALSDRIPTSEELDQEMGPPRASWLAPLRALLRDEAYEALPQKPD